MQLKNHSVFYNKSELLNLQMTERLSLIVKIEDLRYFEEKNSMLWKVRQKLEDNR